MIQLLCQIKALSKEEGEQYIQTADRTANSRICDGVDLQIGTKDLLCKGLIIDEKRNKEE